jgi:hypothetical protein
MGNCCSDSTTRPSPAPTQTTPSTHPTPIPSSYEASSSKAINGWPSPATQHDHEMTPIPSPKHSAVTPERMRSQDSTSSHDRGYPPPSSGSIPHLQEVHSHLYRSRGRGSAQLHESMSMDTPSPEGPRSHSSRMTRTPSTPLLGNGHQPTGTQVASGPASRTSQMSAEGQERRLRFPSTLQSLLPNDFRYVVRCRVLSHNN